MLKENSVHCNMRGPCLQLANATYRGLACSLLSSSVNSAGKRSLRVEKSWPSLMKVGPNCRMDSRIHTASARPRAALRSGVWPPG
jgi:hypothetical protein